MKDPMHAEDLDHEELLQLDAEGGTVRFAGQRAILLDTVAMGLLRKYLVEIRLHRRAHDPHAVRFRPRVAHGRGAEVPVPVGE